MCLALPAKVTKLLPNQRSIVNIGGIEREISTALLERVAIGEYVIVHVGYALTKLNEEQAVKTLELFNNMLNNDEVI